MLFVIFEKVACSSFGGVVSDVNILMREKMRKGFERLEWGKGLEKFLTHMVAELRGEVHVFLLRSALVE